MIKKILYVSLILCLFILKVAYATDIVMDLNTTNSTQTVDNTIYSGSSDIPEENSSVTEYEDVSSTITTEYEDPNELSITNMINIILIVVGVVLVLLGIAIIIKLN